MTKDECYEKSEIRSTKSETISKSKIQMFKPPHRFEFRIWVIGICFGFRISDLEFDREVVCHKLIK
jgi:hypothetical protein